MNLVVVLALILSFRLNASGKGVFLWMEPANNELTNQLEGVDILTDGTFIEDSSGGKTVRPAQRIQINN